MNETLLAFLDTETGGLRPGTDPVIEVATILTDLAGVEFARFEAKLQLRTGDIVQREAALINGYDPEVWAKEAKPFGAYVDFLKAHLPFGHLAIPVGHNVGFDRDMLDLGYFKRRSIFCPLSYHKIDTVGLALVMRAAGLIQCENVKLGTVAAALDIPTPALHRAMADCETAKAIWARAVLALSPSQARSVLDVRAP